MIKILICCLGGFSSSAMVTKVKNEVKEKELEDEIKIDFSPFGTVHEIIEDYDVVMVCPHIKYELPNFVKKYPNINVPLYILPPRMYGSMRVEELYQDAVDVVNGYKKSKKNPWNFPDEEDALRIRRSCSYKRYKEGYLD